MKIKEPISRKMLEDCEEKYLEALSLIGEYREIKDANIRKEKALELRQYLGYFEGYLRESEDACILLIISDIENVLGKTESAERHHKRLNDIVERDATLPNKDAEIKERKQSIFEERRRETTEQMFNDLYPK